jgi:hypothetical protein
MIPGFPAVVCRFTFKSSPFFSEFSYGSSSTNYSSSMNNSDTLNSFSFYQIIKKFSVSVTMELLSSNRKKKINLMFKGVPVKV